MGLYFIIFAIIYVTSQRIQEPSKLIHPGPFVLLISRITLQLLPKTREETINVALNNRDASPPLAWSPCSAVTWRWVSATAFLQAHQGQAPRSPWGHSAGSHRSRSPGRGHFPHRLLSDVSLLLASSTLAARAQISFTVAFSRIHSALGLRSF